MNATSNIYIHYENHDPDQSQNISRHRRAMASSTVFEQPKGLITNFDLNQKQEKMFVLNKMEQT